MPSTFWTLEKLIFFISVMFSVTSVEFTTSPFILSSTALVPSISPTFSISIVISTYLSGFTRVGVIERLKYLNSTGGLTIVTSVLALRNDVFVASIVYVPSKSWV